jgi:hypothetical protein
MRGHIGGLAGSLVALLALLLTTSLALAQRAGDPLAKADTLRDHLVFAELHPWNATLRTDGYWARWNDLGRNPEGNDLATSYWPQSGPYSMGDCGHVGRVGQNLRAAGIDVAVIDWVAFYRGEQQRLETILRCLGIPAVIMVEPTWGRESWADVRTRLDTVIGWYARRTDLFPRYYRDRATGYPLIFVWDPGAVASVEGWNLHLNHLKRMTGERGIFVAGLGARTPVSFVAASLFDGALAENGADPPAQSRANVQWALASLNQRRGQFLVANVVPGLDTKTDCRHAQPRLVERSMTTFDTGWQILVATSAKGRKIHSGYVMYHNDGEDAGIEPATASYPHRKPGFQTCGGRVGAAYTTYQNSSDGRAYLLRNKYWADRFRASR